MGDIKKLLVLTSGGDAPGMNAVIRACCAKCIALSNGGNMALKGGSRDWLNKNSVFNSRSVANYIQRGGTILRTGRFKEFHEKETRDEARQFFKEL